MEHFRLCLRGAQVRGRQAGQARVLHAILQRRNSAQPGAISGLDGSRAPRGVHAASAGASLAVARARRAGLVSQHLGSPYFGLRRLNQEGRQSRHEAGSLAGGICSAQTPPHVKVEGGLLQGTSENGLSVYRGIPFAAPPVGDLRWRPPRPAAKWQGLKPADKFGPRCYQGGRGAPGVETGEDCLYLNVWSPARSARDRVPVLVWIYGGGFSAGATSERNYSGENLAKKGVVLVSIAYRVGQIGFFVHLELSAENKNHASGNYGLLDMIAGLEWVQKNIAAFGGDPHRVTIFGESAGGIAVSMLCAMPPAD